MVLPCLGQRQRFDIGRKREDERLRATLWFPFLLHVRHIGLLSTVFDYLRSNAVRKYKLVEKDMMYRRCQIGWLSLFRLRRQVFERASRGGKGWSKVIGLSGKKVKLKKE
jgi:hypothetical protein